ncbi:unnamed protein product [Prorocentrum cordatum]|uniref:Uncharacterized protein n=1 Tax=Prorocentrum cordatum TaxID=2364126 RepID=A0ABN9SPA2_9DINO|nr:unnamed protein product [Polarella glacialis]
MGPGRRTRRAASSSGRQAADVAELLAALEHDGDATVVLAASTCRASRALLLALAAAAAPPGSPEAFGWVDGAPVAVEADQTARQLVAGALRRQLGAASGSPEASFEAEGAGLLVRLRRWPRAEDLCFVQGAAGAAAGAVPAGVLGRRCAEVEGAAPKPAAAACEESEAAAAMERLAGELGALAAAAGSAALLARPPPASPRRGGHGRSSWRLSASCCDRRPPARDAPPEVHGAQGSSASAVPGTDSQARAVAELLRDDATRVRLLDGLSEAERAEGARELAGGLRHTQRVQLADIASPHSVALEARNPVVAASLCAVELRGRRGCAVSLARGSRCYIA